MKDQIVKGCCVAAGTGAAFVAAPLIVSAVGFGTAGVTGGSTAAAIQSAVYGGSVTAGSIFAGLQSIGATGAAAASFTTAVGTTIASGFLPSGMHIYSLAFSWYWNIH